MKTKDQANREKAMRWWNNLFFIQKFDVVIHWLKSKGEDITSRHPDSLTGREIEEIYDFFHNTIN